MVIRMKHVRIFSVAFMLAAAFASGSSAQRHSHDSRIYFDYGEPMMSSVIQSADGRSVDVRITTANSMFSFLRAKKAKNGAYYAVRDVTIEIQEHGEGLPVISRNKMDTLYANSFEESTSKETWHAMAESLPLPVLDSGKRYTVRIDVRDDIDHLSARPVEVDLRSIQNAHPKYITGGEGSVSIGDIWLADSLIGNSAYASARGNTYMFSRNMVGTVAFRIGDTLVGEPDVQVSVRQLSNLVNPSDTGDRYHATLDISDMHRRAAFGISSADSILKYELRPDSDAELWTAIFNVPGEKFEQGKYQVTVRVRSGNVDHTQKADFMLVWQGMPLSLEDPRDAIEPLKHILSPDQVSAINSGSTQEMTQKLYAYWRTQDPTPSTAYNERMATFYKRVDYADFNYATGHVLDGVMTDRGKIYLLYGPPTNVDRTFLPGEAPVETWTYTNNVKRIFRFEELNGHGEYKLTNVKELAAKN